MTKTRERTEEVANQISVALGNAGYSAPPNIIADILHPIFFPPTCVDCGASMCPICDMHAWPGLDASDKDWEKIDLCPVCKVYIAEDRSTSAVNPEDIRITWAAEGFEGFTDGESLNPDKPRKPKDYVN